MILKKYKGLNVRPDQPVDKLMIKECHNSYKFFSFNEKDLVMDFGTNIGGFAAMALAQPIYKYVGFEADPENAEVAQINIQENNKLNIPVEFFTGAVSTSTEDTITFAQSDSGYGKCSGTAHITSRNKQQRTITYSVKNFNIDKMIYVYQPSLLKIDIEGTEYDWFALNQGVMPKCIREFAIDLHTGTGIKNFCKNYLPNILNDFEVINTEPNVGYVSSGATYSIPEFNLSGKGSVRALDAFLDRKSVV